MKKVNVGIERLFLLTKCTIKSYFRIL